MVNKINYKSNLSYLTVTLKKNNVDELWNSWEIMHVMVQQEHYSAFSVKFFIDGKGKVMSWLYGETSPFSLPGNKNQSQNL